LIIQKPYEVLTCLGVYVFMLGRLENKFAQVSVFD